MEFYEEGEEIISRWTPKRAFQGYNNVLHGGIQATLMDEIASWLVYVKMLTAGVTSKLDIRYKKPVPIDQGALELRAKINEVKRNLVFISIVLYDAEKNLCSQAEAVFFTYSREYSQKHLGYPENPNLYEEEA